ncbi:MAG: TPM domain-containing protein [Nibricoccus sp.]
MKTFKEEFDSARIERAIAAAEKKTSGEIRVVVHRAPTENPVTTAAAEFARLNMHRTRARNAVLILLAPESRTFAVYGDKGIHEKVGQDFWSEVASEMRDAFQHGVFTEGIVKAIDQVATLLATHFPYQDGDINELPDDFIDRGIVI